MASPHEGERGHKQAVAGARRTVVCELSKSTQAKAVKKTPFALLKGPCKFRLAARRRRPGSWQPCLVFVALENVGEGSLSPGKR